MSGGSSKKNMSSPRKKQGKAVSSPKKKSSPKQKGGSEMVLDAGVANGVKWQKTGSPGNANVQLWLAKDQTIVADKYAMIFVDGAIQLKTEMGALKKAFGRMLSGETAFLSYYTGTDPAGLQRVSLGIPLPGDITCIPLEADRSWKVSQGCFVAGTSNVIVSGRLNLKGIISIGQQEGAVLQTVKAEGSPGSVWLASYGHIERHDLKAGQSLLVDNEHFLACPKEVDYTITKVGNVKSLLFGGEGFAMKFTGPCTLYTQSKGVIALANSIYPYLPKNNN
jgi:uncharacterized protein (TIGR00266 family)